MFYYMCQTQLTCIQGSIAGGFLAQPTSKYPLLQFQFFCTFPYVLPCLVGAGIGIISLIGKFDYIIFSPTAFKVKLADICSCLGV